MHGPDKDSVTPPGGTHTHAVTTPQVKPTPSVTPSGASNTPAAGTSQVKPPSRRRKNQRKKSVKCDDKLSTHVSQNSKPEAKPSQGVNKVPESATLQTEPTGGSLNCAPCSAPLQSEPTGTSSNSAPQSAPHYMETKQTVIDTEPTSQSRRKTAQSLQSVQSSNHVTQAPEDSVTSAPVQNVGRNPELSIQKAVSDKTTCGEAKNNVINSVVNTKIESEYTGQSDKTCEEVQNSVLTETEVKCKPDPAEKLQQKEKSLRKEGLPKQDVISGASIEAEPEGKVHSQIADLSGTSGNEGSDNTQDLID